MTTAEPYLGPEAKSRRLIDQMLTGAGWVVQDYKHLALGAARGVAVREFPMAPGHGRADYLLFIDRRAVGVVEAKKAGSTLTGVEWQAAKYTDGLPPGIATWAIAEDLVGYTCATPTYSVGTSEVTLLQASPMPGGGWALRFVMDGKGRPLVEQVETSDGGAFTSWTNLVPTGGGTQGRVTGQPGVSWGEAYVSVPAPDGDRIDMQVLDAHHEEAGTFTVDLDQVVCEP